VPTQFLRGFIRSFEGLCPLTIMRDPRLDKLADVLVNYSTKFKPGDLVAIAKTARFRSKTSLARWSICRWPR
jgi:hypothetical protein